jgi:hypothetical protein
MFTADEYVRALVSAVGAGDPVAAPDGVVGDLLDEAVAVHDARELLYLAVAAAVAVGRGTGEWPAFARRWAAAEATTRGPGRG